MSLKHLLLWMVCGMLTACGTPLLASPAPTLQAISISYPPSLQAWADKLSTCAVGNPEIGLYFSQQANPKASTNPSDIDLAIGQPTNDGSGSEPYQIGWEQMVVVVNQENPVAKLSDPLLKQIYSGQVVNWENGAEQPIQVWVLPEGEPARQVFEAALSLSGNLAPEARLAPNPLVLLKEVAADKYAIGYLPQSVLTNYDSSDSNRVKTIQLDQSLEQALRQPVIAITWGEPTGQVRSLLACLQAISH